MCNCTFMYSLPFTIEINGSEKKRLNINIISRLKHDENSMYCEVKLHIDELQRYTKQNQWKSR